MKKLLIGVVLVSMVLALSSCATMSDETFEDITMDYYYYSRLWYHAQMKLPPSEELKKVYEGLLTEACEEHGYTLADYKRKEKELSKRPVVKVRDW